MKKIVVKVGCDKCSPDHWVSESMNAYSKSLDKSRSDPWSDYEFELQCVCGEIHDELDYFEAAWKVQKDHCSILKFILSNLDVARDDSWSYGGMVMPLNSDIQAFTAPQIALYLQCIAAIDFDHFHDDFYAAHDTFTFMKENNPELAEKIMEIFKLSGSSVVDELISEEAC